MKQNETTKTPKYSCEICNFNSNNKNDYSRHLLTAKHLAETTKTSKYSCEICNLNINNKKECSHHLLTAKNVNETNMKQQNSFLLHEENIEYKCQLCCSNFASRTTLWRHKQKCVKDESSDKPSENKDILLDYLIKQNSELQKQIIDVCKNMSTTNNSVTQVNSNNKTFNLQVFLNEDCKDAMNINEFIDSIQFQLSDLENVGRLGYVEGISNIIIKNLNALDVTKRPVHCTDPKRETIYIKDGGNWEKDENGNKKLRKMVKSVAFRNSKNTRLFKEKYPDCIKSESRYSDIYNKIVIESMGGGPKCNDFDSENKIIRKIAQMITIDKQRT